MLHEAASSRLALEGSVSDHDVATFASYMLWIAVPLFIISVCLMLFVRSWQRQRQDDEIAVAAVQNALQRHDQWRQTASPRAFELHRRECPRCRGDLFGESRFVDPPNVSAASGH